MPHAVGEVCGEISEALGPGPAPDVVFVFCSGDHIGSAGAALRAIDTLLAPRICLGAASSGTLAGAREVEGRASLSVWAARLGEAVEPVSFDVAAVDDGVMIGGTSELVDATGHLVLIGDPSGLPATGLLANLALRAPELVVVGGLAPPVGLPPASMLFEGTELRTGGAVGLRIADRVPMRTLVAQGCRPVGEPMVVTGAEGSMLTELAGRSPLARIRELAEQLEPADRELADRGLHLGLVVDEHREDFGLGDFVVRNVIGAESDTGSLAVGEQLSLGAIVQFQVRDPVSAQAELAELAERAGPAEAALVFAGLGRGAALFGEPHHDATAVADFTGAAALAGMFCTGALGPIAGSSRVHTYSSVVALFGDG